MSLTPADVDRLARLARVELSPADTERTLARLNDILKLVDALQAVDTRGVEPMTHTQDVALRLREDVVTEGDRRDEYQRVAPAVERGLYLVPRVIE